MPDAPEIHPLMLQLRHFDDFRKPLEPLDHRVGDGFTKASRHRTELRRRERLITEKDHEMIEQGLTEFCDQPGCQRLREVNAADFRPQRPCDFSDAQIARCHLFPLLRMIRTA